MANITIRTRTSTSAYLLRPRPQDDAPFECWAGDNNSFLAYVHVDVLDFIRNEARRTLPNETIGLLAGRVCEDPQTGPYTIIVAAENARPDEFESSPAHVSLRGAGQAHVRGRLEHAHPDREIVGWYHTHPNYPSVFSSVDINEQRTWTERHHVGIVYSTSDQREPFGVYCSSDSIRLQPIPKNPGPQIPHPVQLLQAEPDPVDLTPRPEPPEIKSNFLINPPAALPSRMQILIMSVLVIVIVGQTAYLFRVDRRLSFTEGRMQELSASREVLDRVAERLAAQAFSTPVRVAASADSAVLETDGPELRLPAKPLKSQTTAREQHQSQRRRATNSRQSGRTPQ